MRVAATFLLMALLAGISTVLGSSVLFCMPEGGPPPSAMGFSLSMAAGVMLTVSAEMLDPHHADDRSWWWYVAIFCISAVLCFVMCKLGEYLLGQSDAAEAKKAEGCSEEELASFQAWRLSLLLFVALTAHNFPEGFAVAISSLESNSLGFIIMLAIAMHNIPEGIAISVPVLAATSSRKQALWMSFLSGMAEPVGAVVAMVVVVVEETFQSMTQERIQPAH